LLGLSPDGKDVWLLTWVKGISAPRSYALADGEPTSLDKLRSRVHLKTWDAALIEQRNDRVVAGVIHGTGGDTYEFLDPQLDARWQAVIKALGGTRPTIISGSDDIRHILVRVLAQAAMYGSCRYAGSDTAPLGPSIGSRPRWRECDRICGGRRAAQFPLT
jgi:hypothetical protein